MTLRYNILQEVRRKKLGNDDERRLRAEQGVYGISVAADLVGVGQQTLRLYERKGLVEPERTEGGTRRYSENDVERLRRIGELVDDGLNLAGVDKVLRLEEVNAALQRELDAAKERDRRQKRSAKQG
ncbi:MerR family transcriptional regulator [Arthrobacter sp. VKM Ac-2550]|uniref:MerR family transcriptional regulator n=1 Tax=Crystallibacter permensis TaxID=1938888 RepID=UPI0022278F6D|nr:MerR family transcriptional regulator [Arthrobacter sp. VKM Ac-2550]MCW2134938.1 DNA-binding transcriptional regulator, MerR family [Arthrobacter sp. VKM Ac-2550]